MQITNDTGECAPLSALSESCRDDIDCQVGLVCNYNSNKCIEMFSIKKGENSNGPYYCESVLYNDNAGTCIGLTGDAECSAVNGDENYQKCLSDTVNGGVECKKNYNDTYTCPTEWNSAFEKYVKIYKEKLGKLSSDDKKNKYINRKTLNNDEVTEALANYEYFYEINSNDDCIKDYYIEEANSKIMSLTSIFAAFMILMI